VRRADTCSQFLPPLRSGWHVLRVDPDAPTRRVERRGKAKRKLLLFP
jgi:hypothetical protein